MNPTLLPSPPAPPSSPLRRMGLCGAVLLRAAAPAAALLASAATTLAQSTAKKEIPQPPSPPPGTASFSPILSILVGIVLGGLVLGAAFIPSKRGHQD